MNRECHSLGSIHARSIILFFTCRKLNLAQDYQSGFFSIVHAFFCFPGAVASVFPQL